MSSVTTDSGLIIEDIVVGEGAVAEAGQQVSVHYTGWLLDGTKFDSSKDRNDPFDFGLGRRQVIAGWDEGVQGMKIGGTRKLTIPSQLGYGARGAGGLIPPNATLVFEVELLGIDRIFSPLPAMKKALSKRAFFICRCGSASDLRAMYHRPCFASALHALVGRRRVVRRNLDVVRMDCNEGADKGEIPQRVRDAVTHHVANLESRGIKVESEWAGIGAIGHFLHEQVPPCCFVPR